MPSTIYNVLTYGQFQHLNVNLVAIFVSRAQVLISKVCIQPLVCQSFNKYSVFISTLKLLTKQVLIL